MSTYHRVPSCSSWLQFFLPYFRTLWLNNGFIRVYFSYFIPGSGNLCPDLKNMYNKFYDFSESPFNLTPDPKFLFLSPTHREALASMIYGINERKGFIALIGEVGTGKTTLIYTLLNNLSEKVKKVLIYHTTTTFEQLLKTILHELDVTIEKEDKTSLLQKLNEHLIKKLSKEETLAIIIDEAQNLPIEVMEELRMLSNLETSKSKLFQIILVGQPELEEKLSSENLRQLKQRIGIRRHIKPLSPKECKEYINHRLKLVGSSSSKVFSSNAISLIVSYSRGIPRTINILCDNSFLIGYGLSQSKIKEKTIREVIEDLKDHTKIPSPSEIIKPSPPSSRKAFSFKTLSVILLSIIALLLILTLLVNNGTFQDQKTAQVVSTQNELSTKHKEIPSSIPPTKKVSEAPIPPADAQPETKKKPVKKESPQKEITSKKSAQKKPLTPAKRSTRQVVIRKGVSLYSLALKTYLRADETFCDLILQANPAITDVRTIPDKQKITLPEITPESYIKKVSENIYQVYVGTFETFDLATLTSSKVNIPDKQLSIEPHKFSSKDTWYRLTMGNFNSKEAALKTVNLLKEQGFIHIPPSLK